jgi:hypothetical protein
MRRGTMVSNKAFSETEDRTKSLETLGEQVDRAVTVCTRHQFSWGATTQFWEYLYRRVGRSLCLTAAELIAENVQADDTVIISAGWVKHPFHALGEYDGFAGAAALARAINIGLGARALIVTDEVCIEPFRRVLNSAEMRVWDLDDEFYDVIAYRASSVTDFPVEHEMAEIAASELMDKTNARAMIAVERSDENEYAIHHEGGGGDMSPWTAKVPYLFREAMRRGVPTIGCFDIGNEIGGASVREIIPSVIVPLGEKCRCPCGGSIAGVTETSIAVVGRSSNAAAYGICACLAAILRRPEVLHERALQLRMMEQMMSIPLADGPSLVSGFTEDGAPGELTLNLLDLLHWLVIGGIRGEGAPWKRPPYV